jgi:hypothetical protein
MEKLNNCLISESPVDKRKYDLVFIGGGPSTLSFISYLFQKKFADKFFNTMNILIIEKGENFGSGCIGKYGINTNTSSEGFPRLICYTEGESKEKAAKFALSPSKNNMKSSKNYNNEKELKNKPEKNEKVLEYDNQREKVLFKKMPLFMELFQSSAVQTLIAIGNRPAPLSLVGYFLDCLGNFLVHHIKKNFNKNILLTKAEVGSIKMYNNEEFGIIVKKNNSDSNFLIKTKSLVLATGGKQSFEHPYFSQIANLKGEDRVFHSDFILRQEGYEKITQKLSSLSKSKKKVVIIGGSHSGFSSAWILLNGPSTYKNIKIGDDYEMKKEINCEKCNQDGNFENECTCYGKVLDRNWILDEAIHNKIQQEIEISILYRDLIRVYYPSEEEAASENYTTYNPREACNKQGRVYPFIGIRGDAKDLYNKILRGEESRVKLIHTPNNKEQMSYINEADVVIWACGYVTNNIKFCDSRNHPVEFTQDESGLIEVDKQLQLLNKNKISIKNLYGLGQGYSTKTPEIINGKKARADSIHIYNTYIASKLYRSLEYLINKTSVESLSKGSSISMMNLKRNTESIPDHKLPAQLSGGINSQLPLISNIHNLHHNFKMPKKNSLQRVGRNIINTHVINKENENKKQAAFVPPHTTKNHFLANKNSFLHAQNGIHSHGLTHHHNIHNHAAINRGSPPKYPKNLLMHTEKFKPRRLIKEIQDHEKLDKLEKSEKIDRLEKLVPTQTFNNGVNNI